MATYSKPTTIPRWATTSSNIVEPSEGKKDDGWGINEIPPSSYENWRTKSVGEWCAWIDERFDDGTTDDILEILYPGTSNVAVSADASTSEFSINGLIIDDDSNFNFSIDGSGDPLIAFDTGNDYIKYDRSDNKMFFGTNGPNAYVSQTELWHIQAIKISSNTRLFDNVTYVELKFDNSDYIWYQRSTNEYEFYIGSTKRASISTSRMWHEDRIGVYNDYAYLDSDNTSTILSFDNTDYIKYTKFTNILEFNIGGTTYASLSDSALTIPTSITVGDSGYTPHARADKLIIDDGTYSGITIVASAGGESGIYLDETDGILSPGEAGKIIYDHSTEDLDFYTSNENVGTLSTSGLTSKYKITISSSSSGVGVLLSGGPYKFYSNIGSTIPESGVTIPVTTNAGATTGYIALGSGVDYMIPVKMPKSGTISSINLRAIGQGPSAATINFGLYKKSATADPTTTGTQVGTYSTGVSVSDTAAATYSVSSISQTINSDTLYWLRIEVSGAGGIYTHAVWVEVSNPDALTLNS